jgi:ABC-type sugar transport system ATPase subunit
VRAEGGEPIRVSNKIPSGSKGRPAMLGVRPEDLTLATTAPGIFNGKVMLVEKLGEVTMLYVDVPGAKEPIVVKLTGDVSVERGADVGLTTATGNLHIFDENGISFPRANA